MIELAKQIVDFYVNNLKKPQITDLKITDSTLLEKTGALFVTLYKKGEVRGSAGNIKELAPNIVQELIENMYQAMTQDTRFKPITLNDVQDLKIRIDIIDDRHLLKDKKIADIDPSKSGIIAIKTNYDAMAAVLPNIHPKLITGNDIVGVLKEKLEVEAFKEADYIIYEIFTTVETDY